MPSTSEVAASVGQTVLATGPVKVGGKKQQKTEKAKGGKAANKALVRHTRKVKKAYKTFVKLANKKVGGQILGEQIVGGTLKCVTKKAVVGKPAVVASGVEGTPGYVPASDEVIAQPEEYADVKSKEECDAKQGTIETPSVTTDTTSSSGQTSSSEQQSNDTTVKAAETPTVNASGGRRKSIKKTSFKPGSLVKGSQEAKDYMASLRAMRK